MKKSKLYIIFFCISKLSAICLLYLIRGHALGSQGAVQSVIDKHITVHVAMLSGLKWPVGKYRNSILTLNSNILIYAMGI